MDKNMHLFVRVNVALVKLHKSVWSSIYAYAKPPVEKQSAGNQCSALQNTCIYEVQD